MTAPESCESLQERIVRGDPLAAGEAAHVGACPACRALASQWMALEAAIAGGLDAEGPIPPGFADRVMARIEADTAPSAAAHPWADRLGALLARRWFQVALAQVGVLAAIANLVRVVFSTLVPTASLGGSP
jgi:hypothetical protein